MPSMAETSTTITTRSTTVTRVEAPLSSLQVKAQVRPLPALSWFSSVEIADFVDSGDDSTPLSLNRAESYPAPRFSPRPRSRPEHEPTPPQWAHPRPPLEGIHLSLKLGKSLGEGRTGLVYAVYPVRMTAADGTSLPLNTLPPMCIKVSKPWYCRCLAREAWFYEQLREEDHMQGVVVPLCYGLFTAKLPLSASEQASIVPWEDNDIDPSLAVPPHWKGSSGSRVDPLQEDQENPYLPSSYVEYTDDNSIITSSFWHDWVHNPEHPLVSLLLMERVGEPATVAECARDTESRTDLEEVVNDLGAAYVIQRDMRRFNVLHSTFTGEDEPGITRNLAPPTVCPRHNHVHMWKLVDFEQASRTDERVYERDSYWRTSPLWEIGLPPFFGIYAD